MLLVFQVGYSHPALSLTIEVVESTAAPAPSSSSSIHPFTIALIVLGVLFLLIILAVVVVALLTGTLCFAPKEPREARAGKRREGGEGVGRGGEGVERGREGAAVDTSYVVGQDFRPANQ